MDPWIYIFFEKQYDFAILFVFPNLGEVYKYYK